jgi:hypothetical protein
MVRSGAARCAWCTWCAESGRLQDFRGAEAGEPTITQMAFIE